MRGFARILLALAGAMAAGGAQAGILTCQFTEPFFQLEFDSASGMVTMTSSDEDYGSETVKVVPRIIAEGARLVVQDRFSLPPVLLVEAGGEKVLELHVLGNGSDGMSELIYPLEGYWSTYHAAGCFTGRLPPVNFDLLIGEFGVSP